MFFFFIVSVFRFSTFYRFLLSTAQLPRKLVFCLLLLLPNPHACAVLLNRSTPLLESLPCALAWLVAAQDGPTDSSLSQTNRSIEGGLEGAPTRSIRGSRRGAIPPHLCQNCRIWGGSQRGAGPSGRQDGALLSVPIHCFPCRAAHPSLFAVYPSSHSTIDPADPTDPPNDGT